MNLGFPTVVSFFKSLLASITLCFSTVDIFLYQEPFEEGKNLRGTTITKLVA